MTAPSVKSFIPALLIFVCGLVCIAVAGGSDATGDLPWEIVCITLLFFIVYDAISGIFSSRWVRTTVLGYVMFVIMLVALYVVADKVSVAEMRDLPHFQKFLVLLVIFKVLLTGLAGLYRFFINLLRS